jgi:DNA-3-methyladenine glycosylase I
MEAALSRCPWCGDDPLYIAYHDEEWGVPCHDERRLFEFLILEGAQAGLSWITILRKRDHYRKAFDGFDVTKIARYGPAQRQRLLQDPGIVRNRLKIDAAMTNAQATLALYEAGSSLDHFFWDAVGGRPQINRWKTLAQVPAQTPVSVRLSKALKQRGFHFVGPTIIYAFMQAMGLVCDHLSNCPCHPDHSASSRLSWSFRT